METKSVLVIEDELDIARLIRLHLLECCDQVELADNGLDGLKLAQSRDWDLILLDLRLPGMNGLDICKQLRSRQSYVPILMLTAKSSELDRVLGLEIGADDYLTKPFSVQELVARVKAIFRRCEAMRKVQQDTTQQRLIRYQDLELDADKRQARRQGDAVELTAREFDLLFHFASHPGRVFSRAQLLDCVWGYGHDGYEHTVNSHINRLRSKIEPDPAHPIYILTVWGVGYRFGQ
ncbi:response regulator transcription factor [Ketobacter sp. MCCC 1A13808]|uniref:response regulator transcription factor n=1 Tax=Ketobacter sp. MCCC 1A13808 TaxID=2602738 RepID=UPI000F0F9057|nr:response regulator transcription factor [Ketobacter sp. MCCC 1A13808]MVF14050.1 response regulator transcription factor [Ketobacter sp. MCCC 1A13808]RLP55079.1 MAG: DNA-binding response regulator [Ketobacter sp.]